MNDKEKIDTVLREMEDDNKIIGSSIFGYRKIDFKDIGNNQTYLTFKCDDGVEYFIYEN